MDFFPAFFFFLVRPGTLVSLRGMRTRSLTGAGGTPGVNLPRPFLYSPGFTPGRSAGNLPAGRRGWGKKKGGTFSWIGAGERLGSWC